MFFYQVYESFFLLEVVNVYIAYVEFDFFSNNLYEEDIDIVSDFLGDVVGLVSEIETSVDADCYTTTGRSLVQMVACSDIVEGWSVV